MSPNNPQLSAISTGTMIRFLLVLGGVALLWYVGNIVAALLFAIIIASAFEPAVHWLQARKVPRIISVILIFFFIAFLFSFLIYLIFPILTEEIQNLAATLPQLRENLFSRIDFVEILPLTSFVTENIEQILKGPAEYVQGLGGGVVGFASAVFGGVFTFLLIVVFSFYLLVQEKGIDHFIRLVSPVAYEPYIIDLWSRAQRKLGLWLRAQLLLGAIVGILIFFGLTILGVKHAFLFAIIAAVFELIPVAGPILAAVPAVAVAFLMDPVTGILVIALYILVQQIESNVIIPVVMRQSVGLSPLIVVLALLIGAKLGGIFGILLAVPITAVLAELLEDWDKKKRELIPTGAE